ncbi:MAG: M23 family metallopeptidase [Ruminococcaceae bacterium]|nr:M23 family metallopeptidase [Oscillospiraceae bacterium]
MSILPGSIAAAAESAINRNTGSEPSSVLKPFIWLYRNLCWYGMQIERYARRFVRRTKHFFAPTVAAAATAYQEHLLRPANTVCSAFRQIGADSKMALREIKSAHTRGGIRSAAAQTAHSLAAGAVKHKRFATTFINYALPIVCILLMISVATSLYTRSYVLAVECDGKLVGYVDDESTYTEATELVSERVITSSEQFRNALTPTYSIVPMGAKTPHTASEICNNILISNDGVEDAYGFYVDGDLIGAVRSEGDLIFITQQFLEQYRRGYDNETVGFVEDTKVVKGLYSTDVILSSQEMKDIISSSRMETERATIRSGDTTAKIAERYGMTPERFFELNNVTDEQLIAGESVIIEREQPILRVKSVITTTYEAPIAYSTVTKKDASKYTTYKELEVKGVNGIKLMEKKVTYIGGEQYGDPEYTQIKVIKEPVDEVYIVGTKATTTTKYHSGGGSYTHTAPAGNATGTGRFTWPLPGVNTVSSKYGMRWGRLHSGIDISCGGVYGRTIVAADSGTVTMVKNSPSGYGLHLTISHGNGYSTLYAHCSSISVSAGQKVSKGQAIAKVGNSGRSTGPHLHFEIRVNGSAKNPMNWY